MRLTEYELRGTRVQLHQTVLCCIQLLFSGVYLQLKSLDRLLVLRILLLLLRVQLLDPETQENDFILLAIVDPYGTPMGRNQQTGRLRERTLNRNFGLNNTD